MRRESYMHFTTKDIAMLGSFAEPLAAACNEMREGIPVSRALANSNISRTTFYSLLKGLRQSEAKKNDTGIPQDIPLHPAWQDELMSDICRDDGFIIRPDFEETLKGIADQYLEPCDARIIHMYYKDRKTLTEISDAVDMAVTTVEGRKAKALRILHRYKEELIYGEEYLRKAAEMAELYRKYEDRLEWLSKFVSYLNDIGEDIAPAVLTEEENQFLRSAGCTEIAEVYSIKPEMLIRSALRCGSENGEAHSKKDHISPDTKLDTLDLDARIMRSFEREGLLTVADVYSLTPENVSRMSPSAVRGIIGIYRSSLTD